MAYTPYYPGYQPMYYQPPMADQLTQLRQQQFQAPMPQQTPQQTPQQVQTSPSIVWVQSEMEAANYLVAPNSAVTLWDSNAPVVYLKQADASGKPTLTAYDLVERAETPTSVSNVQAVSYVTHEEFDKLAALVSEIKAKKEKKRKVEEDEDDE